MLYRFTLDVCASRENAKVPNYFGLDRGIDALQQTWTGTCWMNPPYGRDVGQWVRKAYESSRDSGATVVCLLPARTDTRWWHSHALRAAAVLFVVGRVTFVGEPASAPFPSVILEYRPSNFTFISGRTVRLRHPMFGSFEQHTGRTTWHS